MYVPQNLAIFTAAFAGAIAGMGVSGKVPTNQASASYAPLSSVAGAFAQQFDTVWGSVPATESDAANVEECCEAAWQNRTPNAVAPFLTPATYDAQCKALVAIVRSGSTYFAAQGIVSPVLQTPAYLTQGSWFIDPVSGNDSNTGATALTALKTHAELSRRWGKGNLLVGQPSAVIAPINLISVTILADLPASDPIDIDVTLPPNTLLAYVGTPTVDRAGTFTAVTVKDRLTNTPWAVEDAATPFTAADINKRIRVSGGANSGQFAFGAKITGASLRMSSFSTPTMPGAPDTLIQTGLTTGVVGIGDPYVVESLTKVTVTKIVARSSMGGTATLPTVGFANLQFQNTGGILQFISMPGYTNQLNAKGCQFNGGLRIGYGQTRTYLLNCSYTNFITALALQGTAVARSGLSLGPAVARGYGVSIFDSDFMCQGGEFASQSNGVQLGNVCVFDAPSSGMFFGASLPGASSLNANIFDGSHRLWGAGNGGAFISVRGGTTLVYQSSIPVGVGAADFNLGLGNAVGSSFDPATGAISAETIPTTWADMAAAVPAGFGGNAHNYSRNAHICLR